jgi:hypothetical protein
MTEDPHWTAASGRMADHFRRSHSIEAILDLYERILGVPVARR